jgi:hypothetical protein
MIMGISCKQVSEKCFGAVMVQTKINRGSGCCGVPCFIALRTHSCGVALRIPLIFYQQIFNTPLL